MSNIEDDKAILIFLRSHKDKSYTPRQVSNYVCILVSDCELIMDHYTKAGWLKKDGNKYQNIE